jgi:hypothetical protein
MFNEPGKGAHSYRLFNIAIVDVLLTIIAAYIFYILIYNKYSIFDYDFIKCLFILFLLSIFFHWLFCVDTTVMKKLKSIF